MLKLKWLVSLFLAISLSGCSTIKSWFPDKEKDYQYRTEIPELIIPDDLGHHNVLKTTGIDSVSPPTAENVAPGAASETADSSQTAEEVVQVERVDSGGEGSRLRIYESFSKSWRMVGKALSRQSIEVVGRDKIKGVYVVQYDPNKKKVTDDSLWDEVTFFFGGDEGQEAEYHIKLLDYEEYSEVFVMDENDQSLTQGAGMALLNSLQQALENDHQQNQDEPQESDESSVKQEQGDQLETSESSEPAADKEPTAPESPEENKPKTNE